MATKRGTRTGGGPGTNQHGVKGASTTRPAGAAQARARQFTGAASTDPDVLDPDVYDRARAGGYSHDAVAVMHRHGELVRRLERNEQLRTLGYSPQVAMLADDPDDVVFGWLADEGPDAARIRSAGLNALLNGDRRVADDDIQRQALRDYLQLRMNYEIPDDRARDYALDPAGMNLDTYGQAVLEKVPNIRELHRRGLLEPVTSVAIELGNRTPGDHGALAARQVEEAAAQAIKPDDYARAIRAGGTHAEVMTTSIAAVDMATYVARREEGDEHMPALVAARAAHAQAN